ncbi:nuclease-related domain-containing protein [Idiomarina sp. A28L]|uniref:nuclease-related domain-containing protein n=1 Tax=Idiomarina sp. A28L TaxID=1036674 RepID=UPI001302CDF2|nr:nuclease-related domain-containing protein [Idiomarina sp. A28L]
MKAKPLNNPAQSLEKRLVDIALDRVFFPLIVSMLVIAYTVYEWVRWYFELPPNPVIWTILAIVFASYSAFKIVRTFKEVKLLEQGIAGEKAVGQFLERLRSDGAEVFHDVQGDNFNLDHVVIHRSGIYVVETKTMSKPATGKTELVFDGQQVFRNGKALLRNPVIQVSAASAWLRELLEDSSGRKVAVKGIVTFPGWFIHSSHNTSKNNIWVLNPRAIPSFIGKQTASLSAEDVHLLKFHLGKYVRAKY